MATSTITLPTRQRTPQPIVCRSSPRIVKPTPVRRIADPDEPTEGVLTKLDRISPRMYNMHGHEISLPVYTNSTLSEDRRTESVLPDYIQANLPPMFDRQPYIYDRRLGSGSSNGGSEERPATVTPATSCGCEKCRQTPPGRCSRARDPKPEPKPSRYRDLFARCYPRPEPGQSLPVPASATTSRQSQTVQSAVTSGSHVAAATGIGAPEHDREVCPQEAHDFPYCICRADGSSSSCELYEQYLDASVWVFELTHSIFA